MAEYKFLQFKAKWCSQCRKMQPIVDELKANFSDKMDFEVVDTEEDIELAQKYNIMSLPSFVILKGEEVIEKIVGPTSKSKLTDVVVKYL